MNPTAEDIRQIVFVLRRVAATLDAQSSLSMDRRDYDTESPVEDAERVREAIALLEKVPTA